MPLNWDLIDSAALTSLGLDKLVEAADGKECFSYCNALNPLVKAESDWSAAQLESLRFVSSVLSMMLAPSDASQPYGAMFQFGESRSAIPTDW